MSAVDNMMDIDEQKIDEGLYSRQLWADFKRLLITIADWLYDRYVLGHEGFLFPWTWIPLLLTKSISAMKRMAASNVLISGMQGLGVEIGTLNHVT